MRPPTLRRNRRHLRSNARSLTTPSVPASLQFSGCLAATATLWNNLSRQAQLHVTWLASGCSAIRLQKIYRTLSVRFCWGPGRCFLSCTWDEYTTVGKKSIIKLRSTEPEPSTTPSMLSKSHHVEPCSQTQEVFHRVPSDAMLPGPPRHPFALPFPFGRGAMTSLSSPQTAASQAKQRCSINKLCTLNAATSQGKHSCSCAEYLLPSSDLSGSESR